MKKLIRVFYIVLIILSGINSAWAITVSVRVSSSNDDGEEQNPVNTTVYRNSTDLEFAYDGGTRQHIGMRFQSLAIPSGATINSAYIEFEVDETDSGTTNVVIYGQDTDDAGTFGNGANNISNRTRTTASVNWSIPVWNTISAKQQTPDIASVIQEIIDRGGWSSGNDLAIIVEPGSGCSSSSCQRTAESFDGEPANAPLLVIDYTVGGGGSCDTFRDTFSVKSYANQDGTANWSSDWVELGDNANVNSGDVNITGNRLHLQDDRNGIMRSADLSGYATATITFDYQESSLDSSSEYAELQIRTGGSGGWTPLQRFAGPTNETDNTTIPIDLYIDTNTEVRFITPAGGMQNNDDFFIDNFQIEACSAGEPTVDNLTTTDNTPVITGTFDSGNAAGGFTVLVNSVTYTLGSSAQLTNTGDDWTLDLSSSTPLAIGLYDVVATVDDGAGNLTTDSTVDELEIIAPVCNATFRDEFSSTSYGNNDGDTNFAADWDEFEGTSKTVPETSPNPSGGRIRITGGVLRLRNTPEDNDYPGVERQLDLSAFTSATFTFNYTTSGGVDAADSLLVKVSANGGLTWTTLEDISGINDTSGSKSYDISAYISSNTRIRLRFNNETDAGSTSCCYGGTGETISIDNVNIDAVGSCATVDHFNINVGGGSANTCNPFNFSVIAEDSSNNPVTDYTGTVAITTSTAHGNFSTVTATNTVIPNPDNDDNGSASYSFDALDAGSVGLSLANEHAETLTITLTDSAVPVASTSANVVFSDNAFTITDTDAGVAGDDIPVAGRNHSYQVQMIRKDPLTGCGVATGYDGVKNLKMWRTKNADPSPNAPVLDGTILPDADPGVANGNMTFSSGVANVTLQTTDIGRYTIELADISNTFADITISGTSNEQIVRPFGIGIDFSSLRDADFADNGLIDDSTGVDLSYADGIAGSVFTQAGEDFNITVAGVLWNTADDADNNGIPDAAAYLGNNPAAPSFGAEGETVTINATVFEPTGASTGIFSVDGVGGGLFNNFAAGTGTQNAVMTYSNVGIIDISASLTDTDYLGSGVNITGSAPRVGRFNPHHYTVTSSLVNNACVAGLFTYSRQPFTVDVTLEAQNKTNIRTDGYRGTYATLDVLTELTIENSETTAAYDSEVITISETFDAGTIASTQLELELRWDMPEQIQTISQVNMLDTSDEVTSILASPVNLGSTEVRFGRLNMDNVFGSELLTLTMPMYVEYFNGTNYIVNDSDSVSCSVVASTDLVVVRSLSGGSSTEVVDAPLPGRMDIHLTLTPAGSGNTGELNITADISGLPWLQYDWDGLPGLDNPSARATFGIYSGDTRQIYYRQIYQ